MIKFIRLFALWLAVLAYAGAGANASVQKSEDGTLIIPICSVDGMTSILIDLGADAPVETTDMSCPCGIMELAISPDTPAKILRVVPAPPTFERLTKPFKAATRPLWPGAPPIGPPLGYS